MWKLENYQALLWWIALFHIFSQSFKINCWNAVIFVHFSMHGCPLRLGPYLKGEGMYQKSENMWSFQMTPSNYRYVIFMWAKCLHRETTWQTKFAKLAYKLVDFKFHRSCNFLIHCMLLKKTLTFRSSSKTGLRVCFLTLVFRFPALLLSGSR